MDDTAGWVFGLIVAIIIWVFCGIWGTAAFALLSSLYLQIGFAEGWNNAWQHLGWLGLLSLPSAFAIGKNL